MLITTLKSKFRRVARTENTLFSVDAGINFLERTCVRVHSAIMKQLALHRIAPFRHRYWMTRNNRLRFRYVTGIAVMIISGFVAMFGAPTSSLALKMNSSVMLAAIEPAAQSEHVSIASAHALDEPLADASAVVNTIVSSGIRKASLAIKKPERPLYKQLEVKSGDTVAGLLQSAGLEGSEAYQAVKALGEYYDVRKVKSGQKIDVYFKDTPSETLEFAKLSMKIDPVKEINVVPTDDGYSASIDEKELFTRRYARKATIQTSLYGSAARASIPSSVIAKMIRIYSWNIDFQRDIRKGDNIEVLYEAFETEDGEFARYGEVLYANLSVGGREYPIYRFEKASGDVDYFEPDGMSIRKTLMKTPVDGARISSGFGMRRHPVLGYNKMHKGMDFAAPTGTPIYAAGDGVVEKAGRKGSYGNYIRIRHNSKLKTAYAHLHRISSNVKAGTRVKQGQVIGQVGTTGRSTGPHLHYEVLLNNKQVNPRSVNLPTGEQLKGKDLDSFKALVGNVYQQYVSLSEGLKFAAFGERSDDDES